ncbi:hypothetical protein [Glaciihabitans sp. GrIS 2.15]|uniref:hypothetical protein n=1 Tax=Glaciihabitans sp. GrIS 2.15 TaxID=3071710 RepID=UPI002E00716E|nr:hypothetical protein [Glaciihabitans sp. GrIS 2.15]
MIRALPVSVHPVDGETSESYFQRLATANSLPTETLWGYLRQLHGGLPIKRDAEFATTQLEALGGLPEHWFNMNRNHHLLPIRCPHSKWKFGWCALCCRVPAPQSGCIRCSRGQLTQVTTRTGPICLHHARWHYQGTDVDVSDSPSYITAERRVRFELASRGISLDTGELQLANALLYDWAGTFRKQAPQDRTAILGRLQHTQQSEDQLRFAFAFPEAVRLTVTLTDPQFTELLLDPKWSPSQHAYLLSTAIAQIVGKPLSDPTVDSLWETIYMSRRAVDAAYGMVGTQRSSRQCRIQRAFSAAAYTHRACLLRHLDAKSLQNIRAIRSGPPAPSSRAIVKYQQPHSLV